MFDRDPGGGKGERGVFLYSFFFFFVLLAHRYLDRIWIGIGTWIFIACGLYIMIYICIDTSTFYISYSWGFPLNNNNNDNNHIPPVKSHPPPFQPFLHSPSHHGLSICLSVQLRLSTHLLLL